MLLHAMTKLEEAFVSCRLGLWAGATSVECGKIRVVVRKGKELEACQHVHQQVFKWKSSALRHRDLRLDTFGIELSDKLVVCLRRRF